MAFAKFVFTQPRFTAVLFISSTKEDTEPLTCSASAVATSFAEGSKRPYRQSLTLKDSPICIPMWLLPLGRL